MVEILFKSSVGLMLLGVIISACGPLPEKSAIIPTPILESCTFEKSDYKDPVEQRLIDIYENSVVIMNSAPSGNNGFQTQDFNYLREQAFNELINRVYDWSDAVEVKVGEKEVRITITYISPELIHVILLNHYLYKAKFDYAGNLDAQIQSDIAGILARKEHIFFIIFTVSQYEDVTTNENALGMDFPIRDLVLTNVENITANPERDDHNLENIMALTEEPAYGFFYYPMAIRMNNGDCLLVLDKNRDTRIVLSISSFSINGEAYGPFSWEYTYAPLLQIPSDSGMKNGKFSISPDPEMISPYTSKIRSTSLETPEFWAAIARLIWFETTHDL